MDKDASMNTRRPLLPDARLSLAPMLDLTDRHLRYFLRTLSRHLYLYTEMISTGAIIYGSRDYLRFDGREHPIALQLGGSDRHDMAKAAAIGAARGYDEININAGCPSSRVQAGTFGAVLMKNLPLLYDVVRAVKDAVTVPVTVKTRLGVDELQGYDFTRELVKTIYEAGADGVILHARNACLNVSPRDNREKPPLDYEAVYRIKRDFPDMFVGINGNIMDLSAAEVHLKRVDGVMMGRALYRDPYILEEADFRIFGESRSPWQGPRSRAEVIRAMYPYIEHELAAGEPLKHIVRHFTGMFQSCPNARKFRQYLSLHQHLPGAGIEVLEEALRLVEEPGEASLGGENSGQEAVTP